MIYTTWMWNLHQIDIKMALIPTLPWHVIWMSFWHQDDPSVVILKPIFFWTSESLLFSLSKSHQKQLFHQVIKPLFDHHLCPRSSTRNIVNIAQTLTNSQIIIRKFKNHKSIQLCLRKLKCKGKVGNTIFLKSGSVQIVSMSKLHKTNGSLLSKHHIHMWLLRPQHGLLITIATQTSMQLAWTFPTNLWNYNKASSKFLKLKTFSYS